MSVTSIIGGIVGGVIGFIMGGPTGAYYGAMIGFSLGMVVDPLTPDVPQPGNPDPESFENMSNDVGVVMPDLVGTAKINGHLLWYGNESSSLGYDNNYKYYMSWVLGIVTGPINALYAIYKNDDILWEGDLNCPTSGGEEIIAIDGFGSITFYFGTSDQVANTTLGALLSDETLNSPNRYLCWAFMNNCHIGSYPRTPTISFIVRKHPAYSFSALNAIQKYDYNPAHALFFILHDLVGLSKSWLHTSDFTDVASTLYDDILGLSMLFKKQQSALAYIQTLNAHISSFLYYGSDARFHLKLIRGDYKVATLPTIDETMLLEEPEFSRRSWIDTINEVKVQYTALRNRSYYSNVWCTGHNDRGQLGLDHLTDQNTFVEFSTEDWNHFCCGEGHTLGIMADGTLWGVGRNAEGQLGLGHNSDVQVFTRIGTKLWTKIAAGRKFTMAVDEDGTVWGTGENTYGQLGLGDTNNKNVFTQIPSGPDDVIKIACGGVQTLIIHDMQNRTLWGAGSGSALAQGSGNNKTTFVQITDSDISSWVDISCGYLHSAMIAQMAWTDACVSGLRPCGMGDNTYGQLGLGDYTSRHDYIDWSNEECDYEAIWSGGYHTFARKDTDALMATGRNDYGQLGLGDNTNRSVFLYTGETVITCDCGGYYTMMVKDNYTLWGTGRNDKGQLGLGHNTNKNSFDGIDLTSCRKAVCGDCHTFVMD